MIAFQGTLSKVCFLFYFYSFVVKRNDQDPQRCSLSFCHTFFYTFYSFLFFSFLFFRSTKFPYQIERLSKTINVQAFEDKDLVWELQKLHTHLQARNLRTCQQSCEVAVHDWILILECGRVSTNTQIAWIGLYQWLFITVSQQIVCVWILSFIKFCTLDLTEEGVLKL